MIKSAKKLTLLTNQKPLALHIDFIGLLRLGLTTEDRLEAFSKFLSYSENSGQAFAIPAFTYSFTKNEPFNILNSPSQTGLVTEYLRKTQIPKRTSDGIFSYLIYGKDFVENHFECSDYESFGKRGIAGEIFAKDGWIGSTGGVFRHATEIHFLEKLLNVEYRFDKDFEGDVIDIDGSKKSTTIKYFCRKDLSIRPDFRRFEEDLKKEGLMQIWQFEDIELEIEAVKIRDAYELLKTKIAQDEHYLCIEVDKWIP
jgi:aminoglycoside N3'-acetyltransferase